jgi:superfamily II DNA/RNA helicase
MATQYKMEGLEFVVVDEGDKMFELGFLEQMEDILKSFDN